MIDPKKLGQRIYLDSNIVIYAFEGLPAFREQALATLQAAEAEGAQLVVSHLIYIEVFPKLISSRQYELVERYQSFFEKDGLVEVLPVDAGVIQQATKLRANYQLKTVDALHLATAIAHGCNSFLSHDQALQRVKEIPVLYLD